MEKTQVEFNAMFDKIDLDGNGEITKEELFGCINENEISLTMKDVNDFFAKVDINNDGVISREEFLHFMGFHHSKLAKFGVMLNISSKSMGIAKYLKKIVNSSDLDDDGPSNINLLMKDSDVENTDNLRSLLGIHVGDTQTNPKIAQLLALTQNEDKQNLIGFKFNVEDKQTIIDEFKELTILLKDFLSQLGPEAAEMADIFDFEFVECEDGVLMFVDPTTHPFLDSFLGSIKTNFDQFKNLKLALSLVAGAECNVFDKDLTYNELTESKVFFSLMGNSIKLCRLANSEIVKNFIKKYNNSEKKNEVLSMLYLLSLKNTEMEVEIDSEQRKEFLKNAQLADTPDAKLYEKRMEEIREEMEKSGLIEFLESLDFISEAVKLLKQASCSSVSIVAKIHDTYLVVNIKAEIFELLKEFIDLED